MGEARALLERNLEYWNDHDAVGWAAGFGPNALLTAPGISGSGAEIVAANYSIWQDGFPDNRLRAVGIFEDGDTAIVQAVFEGTHTHTMNTPDGPIPATGRRVDVPVVILGRVAGGKITQVDVSFDRVEMLAQLGVLPASV